MIDVCSRIRMCSTGPDTTPFARPANTPEMNSCPLPSAIPSGPPRPSRTFRAAKNRFEYSSAPNWIETHTPMPSSGVSVPCEMCSRVHDVEWKRRRKESSRSAELGEAWMDNEHGCREERTRGAPNLVKCQGPFVLEDAARTVQHALVRARRCGLHPLFIGGAQSRCVLLAPDSKDRTYHFYDVERLPDQHLSGRNAMGELSVSMTMEGAPRTWAIPPAVPAVRSFTVFDMAEMLDGGRDDEEGMVDV